MNAPQTFEGLELWQIFLDISSQIRTAGLGGIVGFDLGVAMDFARARGVCLLTASEFLPALERAAVAAIQDQSEQHPGEDGDD